MHDFKRNTQPGAPKPAALSGVGPQGEEDAQGVNALVVTPRASVRRRIASLLHGQLESIVYAETSAEAIEHVSTHDCDLIIIERALENTDGIDLLERISTNHPALVGVVVGQIENTEDAVRAMRAGASDIISIQTRCAETARRLSDCVKRARRVRQRDARVMRLEKLCHRLNNAREEVSGQVGDLCNDLVEAYRDLSEQFGDVKLATELNAIMRQELDIESLLRTMLEFTLSKIGSTNAAVFLPTSSGDYSLGAYVNYDIPKDAAEVMLDQLADTIAPRFEQTSGVVTLGSSAELEEALGSDAHWLDDHGAMVIACNHEDECLGVLTLFRNQSRPFDEDDERTLSVIAKLFGEQLGRVIHVHHRHLPKDQWGSIDCIDPEYDEDDDFFGFDDGYGFAA
ncbi:MAG: response regulator [Phycisphaerales bacterium]